MKWSLRNQILFPIATVILVFSLGMISWQAWTAARNQQSQVELRVSQVVRTIAESNFPLTPHVLDQMKGLAGAEFVVANGTGEVEAVTSESVLEAMKSLQHLSVDEPGQIQFSRRVRAKSDDYYVASLKLKPRGADVARQVLYVFYPVRDLNRQLWQAVWPTILWGGFALVASIILAWFVSAQVTSPIRRLRTQVNQIASGNYRPMNLSLRHDELRELAEAVNQMARNLNNYESQIRQTERLRTLGQLGGGLAHQLRNWATGARLAIDMHREEYHLGETSEGLDVAARQLTLMEKYLQKFLTLGAETDNIRSPVDLVEIVGGLESLVQPFARHASVTLEFQLPQSPLIVQGDREGLEQVALNLLLNAIQAASQIRSGQQPNATNPNSNRFVRLELSAHNDSTARFCVSDSGDGPSSEMAGTLFEPFITDKKDGAGLGLNVVQLVVKAHGGSVHWCRKDGYTHFWVEIPLTTTPQQGT